MKRIAHLLILIHVLVFADAQIIADHTVVDLYDEIPEQWMDSVRTMLVDIAGESHSVGYRDGMELLEALDANYQVTTYLGTRPAPSSAYVRLGGHGTVGEADFFTSASAIAAYKTVITSQNESSNPYDVMGFGWCWDMDRNASGGTIDTVYDVRWSGSSVGGPDGDMEWGLDTGDVSLTGNSVTMDTYLDAVEQYNQLCADSGYSTKIVFTTGPVDMYGGTEEGFQREIKHDYIRDYVAADEARILFDYADILCWNDDGEYYTSTWDDGGEDRAHANIHPDNLEGGYTAHIGNVGALRLAKAMWWMLARIAGWEGVPVPVSDLVISSEGGLMEIPFGDSLQYSVQVAPENATNKDVSWSVLAQTGMASISAEGLLIAEGSGLVSVVAAALDGSGVADTVQLSILEPPVLVSEITISSTGGIDQLLTGDTLRYTVEVMPEDAANKEVEWSVINGTGTATISQNGLLTGGNPGSVDIIAMARDGSGVSDTSLLNITPPVIPVTTIDIASANGSDSLESGSTLQFSATVLPAEATNKELDWSVENGTGSASITATGLLTAGNPGTVTVVADARDGSGASDIFLLSITTPELLISSITVSSSGGVTVLESEATLQFSATVLPAEASNKELDWSVVNGTGSASITATGLLTAGDPGTVTVEASARDGSGVSGDFILSISTPELLISSITVSSSGGVTVLVSGATLQFSAAVLPAEATNKELDWSVENVTGSASITATGLLTAGNPGTVTVVAAARDGSGVSGVFDLGISTPTIEVESISIESEGNVFNLEEGGMLQLYADVNPSNADNTTVAWHVTRVTKGTGEGTITQDGLFIAISQGDVDVVAVALDGSGVSDMMTLTVLSPTSINDNENEPIRLYPNPGSGVFFLDMGNMNVVQLKVLNAYGSVVLELIPESGMQVLELDLSKQPAGFYFIRVFTDKHSLLKRAIISK